MRPVFWDEMEDRDYVLSAEGWWEDQMLRDETVFEARSGKVSPLKALFAAWKGSTQTFRPPPNLANDIHAVQVNGDWPFAYRWIGHNGLTFGSLSGCSVGDVINPGIAMMTAEHYLLAKQFRRPIYHHLEQTIGGMNREYTRLLLPPVDDVIYYAVRPISINWSERVSIS